MFNKIVIQEESKPLIDEWDVNITHYQENYYVASSLSALGEVKLRTSNSVQKISGIH